MLTINNTLIQPQEVVGGGILKTSPTTAKLDPILVAPYIKIAELNWLVPVLCDDFYKDLIKEKDSIVSNYNPYIDTTCPIVKAFPNNADYETLWVDYLLPYLSFAAILQSFPTIGIQIASSGVFQVNTQYAQASELDKMKYIEQHIRTSLETLKGGLIKYLCENKTKYPLFCSECHCKCDCGCCEECNTNKYKSNNLFISY